MKRGFPRPTAFIEKTRTNPYARSDSYGKKWDNRRYPWPYTASDSIISNISNKRLRATILEKRCSVCGDKVEEDLVGLVLYNEKSRVKGPHPDWLHPESGPFHFPCLALAFKVCPHLAETKVFMPGCGLWDDVKKPIKQIAGLTA